MKTFLKPNLNKIIYFNALLILSIIAYLIGIVINTGNLNTILRGILLFILALPLFIIDITIGTQGMMTITIITILIIQIIYLYTLSCIINHIIKNKKTKKN